MSWAPPPGGFKVYEKIIQRPRHEIQSYGINTNLWSKGALSIMRLSWGAVKFFYKKVYNLSMNKTDVDMYILVYI